MKNSRREKTADPPPLGPILDHYGIGHKPHGGEQSIRCPCPDHDDRHASASLTLGRGLWHCHACGNGGTAIELVKIWEGCDAKAAFQLVEKILCAAGHHLPGTTGPSRESLFESPGNNRRRCRTVPARRSSRTAAW